MGTEGIEEVDGCGIGGVSIGHKDEDLVGICSTKGLFHGNNSRKRVSGIGQVVGGDLEIFGRDEEEDIVTFSEDLDVGFIRSAEIINGSLVGEVEAMAIEGGGSGIV